MAIFQEAVEGALHTTQIDPQAIQVAHVGNFAAELFCKQGHLGAFFVEVDPAFSGLPTARHEAACASGSMALLAASAEIEAGRYEVACVVGIEHMKTVPGDQGAKFLGIAAWYEQEAKQVEFVWPRIFGQVGEEYDKRYGLKHEHLAAITAINYDNAKRNPNAQTRHRYMTSHHACQTDLFNPPVDGPLQLSDCGQITDGAAVVFLVSETFAAQYAHTHNRRLADLPFIRGWGHRTAPLLYATKIQESQNASYVFPHVRGTITDAFQRAHIGGIPEIDGIETHDCFTTTEYMAIDHFGITAPGESWKAIEDGRIAFSGEIPVNPSGGLIGLGHPVGATGVRQLLDCYKQVTGTAGEYQVAGAKTFATLNIGGSCTTSVSFVVGRD